jgi:hypothetical protein
LGELQATLMDDDVWLPGLARPIAPLTRAARLTADAGDAEVLRDGVDRPVEGVDHGWRAPLGAAVTCTFAAPAAPRSVRLIGDSDLDRLDPATGRIAHNLRHFFPLNAAPWAPPATLLRACRIERQRPDGVWQTVARVADNTQRLVRVALPGDPARAVRIVPEATWGAPEAHLFAFEVAD